MKYFSLETVANAYASFQGAMTNKSWGILSILKQLSEIVKPGVTYSVNCCSLSKFLEYLFCLSNTPKIYQDNGNYRYVKFSTQWLELFTSQGNKKPNIYDIIVWAYRKESFPEDFTHNDLLQKFIKDFNFTMEDINNIFETEIRKIEYNSFIYSENDLLNELGLKGDNINAENGSVAASPGELSRGPFIQPLYAGQDTMNYILISKKNFDELYPTYVNAIASKSNKDISNSLHNIYRPYITAIKSKPFLLLAGISGTGKSRIVRELARACWEKESEEYKAQKPANFEMIQVKPNWHDSSELLGYVSRVSGEPVYVAGDFLKFMVKAIQNPDIPHFLCLDEMNLAPVEQYFAEYLSVIESRKSKDGEIVTDPIIDYEDTDAYTSLIEQLFYDDETRNEYRTKENGKRLTIPQNLIVVGTVNMDETTFSFSRKVLDRAMTIEMNEVDLEGGLDKRYEPIGQLGEAELIGDAVEGVDVYADNKEVCDTVIGYLKAINEKLEGTPFKVAYRTRNEFLLYVVNNLPYNKDEKGETIPQEVVIARALDEITNMKILSRIEGDETKVSKEFLNDLRDTIKRELNTVSQKEYSGTKGKEGTEYAVSLAKLKEMTARLGSGYTSFWS